MWSELKLRIELVPACCWGKNLRQQMKESQWKKLRKQVCDDQGNVCCICGSGHRLNCHEIWQYDDERHVQKLLGFHAVCGMCHHVVHFGRAQQIAAEGHLDLDAVIEHFLKVNGVGRREFDAHRNEAFEVFEKRSKHQWQTELGQWASLVS
jgi:hypothetical protein